MDMGGTQAKANEKRQRFKGWETLDNKLLSNCRDFESLGDFRKNVR